MSKATVVKAGVSATVALALSLTLAQSAHADTHPTASDAVAVGSDTVQYLVDFLDDGDANANAGFNTIVKSRVFSFDATADASGRSVYQKNSTTALAATVVLREGSKPVPRPNGSGAGITALNNDTGSVHQISFVRSSRLPTAAEKATAVSNGWGGLHTYQLATDGLQIAVAHAATDAGTAGLTADDLSKIYNGTYTTWGQIPTYNGPTPTHTIIPVIPQTGSGTRNDFIADIKTQTGVDLSVAGALGANVITGEEHDPTAITTSASPADTIEPFSTGRDKLIDTGYFGTTPAPNTIDMLPGYNLARKLYVIARESDVQSTTPFAAGASANFVNTLFGTAGAFYNKASNAALYTSAGVVRAFVNVGL